jgi:hypothetical protein
MVNIDVTSGKDRDVTNLMLMLLLAKKDCV